MAGTTSTGTPRASTPTSSVTAPSATGCPGTTWWRGTSLPRRTSRTCSSEVASRQLHRDGGGAPRPRRDGQCGRASVRGLADGCTEHRQVERCGCGGCTHADWPQGPGHAGRGRAVRRCASFLSRRRQPRAPRGSRARGASQHGRSLVSVVSDVNAWPGGTASLDIMGRVATADAGEAVASMVKKPEASPRASTMLRRVGRPGAVPRIPPRRCPLTA